ncbi:MAG: anaerobic ribonucleoside-triphosphate reductase [Candidatus Thiodiazotropha sp. (ex Notomyrtea botanica)]|nr:anaerobic ribonucleoside-triphosphate reductase [Candidatus Thiodiazotropha sp. (ex Notomyrtea botanica)]
MHKAIELRDEERTRCEIWTRVMGYHRPVSAFNPGKQSEHAERICFKESALSPDPAHIGSA